MPSKTFPIVGAFFRPPAKALLANLAVGTPLTLAAEPDNPADSNAIAVRIAGGAIPETEAMEVAVSAYGFSVPELRRMDSVHLGYIPREMAATERAYGFPNDGEFEAEFSVSANGGPRVRVDVTWAH